MSRSLPAWLYAFMVALALPVFAAPSPPPPPPPPFFDDMERPPAAPPAVTPELKGVSVTWLGHAAFHLVPVDGPRIVIDPFAPMVGSYPWPDPSAEVVLVTHGHPDHSAVERVRGNPKVVRGPGYHKVAGGTFLGVNSFHDDQKGKQRGVNTIFVFTLNQVRFAHLGDLGQPSLTREQLRRIGRVDVLFIPVGGHFTIDAREADRIIAQLRPRIVVPMHYKTQHTADRLPIVGVEGFLKGKSNVRRKESNVETFTWLEAWRKPAARPLYVVFQPPKD